MLQNFCQMISRNLLNVARNTLPTEYVTSQVNNLVPSLRNYNPFTCSVINRSMASLAQMHRKGPVIKNRKNHSVQLDGNPFKRAVVLKAIIKKPKKPNSANRKCVRVRLSNGKEATAYVPGEGHNLQEHSVVLVGGGRLQDVPGVKLRCVRGKYDLAHVKKSK
ncbi:small ribosomal subunit protein uS12m-like [Mytilus trossulus]|uniref:small ribosomal subunit protein uS12m-like n=1 Tax=Mytilus trossulus TaxID=6551 RepID=UPI003004655B